MNKLKKARIFRKYIFYYLPNDRYIGQRIALEKYEPYETQLILRQAKSGDVVVDVGANIGYYTVLLANKVGVAGKVFAFEPDKTNFEILIKNIKTNNLKNVVAVNTAVGSKNGTKVLYKSEENLGDHKLYETLCPSDTSLDPPKANAFRRAGEKEEVKIIKLDDFLANTKVDLMKIDTQGWEPEVIEGAKSIIKNYKPTIFFEYSPASYKAAKLDGDKMMKFIKNIYKNIWWIDEWVYIYKNLSKEKIDEICQTNKTGYADLWVKKNLSLNDKIGRIRNFKVKKWVKRNVFRI